MSRTAGVRSCLAITGSVVAFALLIERAGLIPAVLAAVLIAALGDRQPRMRETIVFGICLAAAMALLFVGLLGQPFILVAGL